MKQSKEHTKELEDSKDEYQRKVKQVNKAIGKKKDDYELDETVEETD